MYTTPNVCCTLYLTFWTAGGILHNKSIQTRLAFKKDALLQRSPNTGSSTLFLHSPNNASMETIRVLPSCGIQDCTVRRVQHRFILWLCGQAGHIVPSLQFDSTHSTQLILQESVLIQHSELKQKLYHDVIHDLYSSNRSIRRGRDFTS